LLRPPAWPFVCLLLRPHYLIPSREELLGNIRRLLGDGVKETGVMMTENTTLSRCFHHCTPSSRFFFVCLLPNYYMSRLT
jgi:hypothetical protein